MAANTLSTSIEIVKPGEDGDQAYRRLYGEQVKPCDFRRWFTVVSITKACGELNDDMLKTISEYVDEGMTVDEAFATHCPDYVGPGEFSVLWNRERLRAIAEPVDVPSVEETLSEES